MAIAQLRKLCFFT